MAEFLIYTVVVLIVGFLFLMILGVIFTILNLFRSPTTRVQAMSDEEKVQKEKEKNLLLLGLGLIVGATFFGD